MKKVDINSDYQQIYSKIKKMKKGTIFFSDDFECSDKAVLRVYLARMVNEGFIKRLGQGIFLYPKYSNLIGSELIPSVDEIASALSKKEKSRIAPSGSYALYKVGLTTQVPTLSVFYTDGSARKIELSDGRTIQFKSASAKNFAYKNSVVQTVVFAMKEIGQIGIKDYEIDHLRKITSAIDSNVFKEDIKLAPEWIQRKLK